MCCIILQKNISIALIKLMFNLEVYSMPKEDLKYNTNRQDDIGGESHRALEFDKDLRTTNDSLEKNYSLIGMSP